MIVRRPHPQDPDNPDRCVFVPLVHEPGRDVWVPLFGPEGFTYDRADGARACLAVVHRAWREVEQLARRLRAFTEHPAFSAFSAEAIDAGMIAEEARALSVAVSAAGVDLARIFDEPGEEDVVRMGGVLHVVDAETGELVALEEAPGADYLASPDAMFLRLIRQALDQVRSATHHSVGLQGFEDAIDMLILMLPEDDPEDGRDPFQFIADHRFGRRLAVAARRVRERTGRAVSDRGLADAITLLQRLRDDRAGVRDDDEDPPDDGGANSGNGNGNDNGSAGNGGVA